jgi:hypothetical protein
MHFHGIILTDNLWMSFSFGKKEKRIKIKATYADLLAIQVPIILP